jgi:hypothetical protein
MANPYITIHSMVYTMRDIEYRRTFVVVYFLKLP